MDTWSDIRIQRLSERRAWVVTDDITYRPAGRLGWSLVVPAGYISDLASVPRWLRWVVDRDQLAAAAVVHDWLLTESGASPSLAHAIFYEAALASGASRRTAAASWAAVTVWSWFHPAPRG